MRNFHRSSTGKFILSILRSTSIQITIYAVLQWVTIYMKFIWQIQLCIVIQVQMIHKWLFGLSGIFFILLKRFLYCSRTKVETPFLYVVNLLYGNGNGNNTKNRYQPLFCAKDHCVKNVITQKPLCLLT